MDSGLGTLQRRIWSVTLVTELSSSAQRLSRSRDTSKSDHRPIPLIQRGYPILLTDEPRNVPQVNRVPHHRGAKEWLEPDEGRLSCPVLRGQRRSNALLLPDQVHGVDARGKVALRRQLKRSQMNAFFNQLAPCLI